MEPGVLYLIVCDAVRPDPQDYHRLNVFGLMASIRSTAYPALPLARPSSSDIMSPMTPELALTVICDYLVEFIDDGTQPVQPEPEVLIPPGRLPVDPVPQTDPTSDPESRP